MTTWILLLALGATADGGAGWRNEEELVAAARAGDLSARARIKQLLQREEGKPFVPSISLPTLLSAPEDMWAEPLLREVAAKEETGLASFALVAWWRLHRERDDGFLRQLLNEEQDRSGIRNTALELLVRSGDPWGIAEQRRQWSEACAPVQNSKLAGLVWKKPTAVEAALVGPFDYNAPELLVVAHVCPGSRAAASGFVSGDTIVKVGATRCDGYRQCIDLFERARDGKTDILVDPAGDAPPLVRRFPKQK